MSIARAPRSVAKRVVLTGFMGSGKTTVGRALGERLDWPFEDLDSAIEQQEHRSVPQIFAQAGEAYFRRAEAEVLARLLQRSHLVIALGGGAPGTPAVGDLLRDAAGTEVIHLQAPFHVLYERCTAHAFHPGTTARPLLGDRKATEIRYEQRRALYSDIAHHVVDAAPSPEAVAAAILTMLHLA